MRKTVRSLVKLALCGQVDKVSDVIGILISAVIERRYLRKSDPLSFGQRIICDKSTSEFAIVSSRADEIDEVVSAISSREPEAIRKTSVASVKLRLQSSVRKPLSDAHIERIGILVSLVFERYYLHKRIPSGVDNLEELLNHDQIASWSLLWMSRPPSVMRKKRTARKKPARKCETLDTLLEKTEVRKLGHVNVRNEKGIGVRDAAHGAGWSPRNRFRNRRLAGEYPAESPVACCDHLPSHKVLETRKQRTWIRRRHVCMTHFKIWTTREPITEGLEFPPHAALEPKTTSLLQPTKPLAASFRNREGNQIADPPPPAHKTPPLQPPKIGVKPALRPESSKRRNSRHAHPAA